ncbi:MAG: hypothetical protein ACRC28_02190 [Clostridium sp.]|uniref:hypothetical protein n=1 Tax=Clostridium sp. TaxID=1506 RepID=UPI003F39DE95
MRIIIFATIIGLIILVGITFLYLNDKLENLNEKNNLSTVSVKKLNLIKTITFLIAGLIIIFLWLSALKGAEKLIVISLILLAIDFIFMIIFKVKYNRYIKKDRKLQQKRKSK